MSFSSCHVASGFLILPHELAGQALPLTALSSRSVRTQLQGSGAGARLLGVEDGSSDSFRGHFTVRSSSSL